MPLPDGEDRQYYGVRKDNDKPNGHPGPNTTSGWTLEQKRRSGRSQGSRLALICMVVMRVFSALTFRGRRAAAAAQSCHPDPAARRQRGRVSQTTHRASGAAVMRLPTSHLRCAVPVNGRVIVGAPR